MNVILTIMLGAVGLAGLAGDAYLGWAIVGILGGLILLVPRKDHHRRGRRER